ncbi:MAG: PHP domain-containing protein [Actinomycetota bacterium]
MEPAPVAIDRHPHLADPVDHGLLRVDCHSHTMWSGDCTTTLDELARSVAEAGIDVLCVTDHHAVAGAEAAREALPCRVVVGEEVRTHAGELIGLFLTERVPQGLPADETARRIRDQGAIVYVPHPFDPMRHCLAESTLFDLIDRELIDAVEAWNGKTSLRSLNRRAAELAVEAGLPAGAGSDAHVPDAIGAAYVEMTDFEGPTEFLAALATARVVGHHWDQPRPWSPRIVPSTTS